MNEQTQNLLLVSQEFLVLVKSSGNWQELSSHTSRILDEGSLCSANHQPGE